MIDEPATGSDGPARDRGKDLQLLLGYLKAGRKQDADALLAEILAADPGNAGPCALLIGGMLARNAQFRDAVPLFEEAIRVNPCDPIAYFYLGAAYHALQDAQACDRAWDHLAAEFPSHYTNYLQKALRALEQDEYPAAISWLQRAIPIAEPDNPLRVDAEKLLALAESELQRRNERRSSAGTPEAC